jgi:hypothetical protein
MNALIVALAALITAAAPAGRFADEIEVRDAISADNLTVFPLRLRRAAPVVDVVTLDEAMRAGLVDVREAGGGAVNTLLVSNRGGRPVYAMAGELLIGGKQDRIIGQALVLPPHTLEVPVPVFCVEHGRWQGASSAFQSAGTLGYPELRKKALEGKQTEVWREVAAANVRLHTETASGTYWPAASKLTRDAAPLAARVLKALDGVPDVVGVAAAVDGRIVAVEYFDSPRLFSRVRSKLVASYAAQALAAPSARPTTPPSRGDVATFADKAERGEALGGVAIERFSGRAVQTSYLAR